MLNVRICTVAGAVIAEGTCSDSGYFPVALASIYNAGLNLLPARSLESFGESSRARPTTRSAPAERHSVSALGATTGGTVSSTTKSSCMSSEPDILRRQRTAG